MNDVVSTHGVIIPVYNAGRKLAETVAEVMAVWPRLIVVDDASTDGCADFLRGRGSIAGITLLTRNANGGKGAAVEQASEMAVAAGWSAALVMDADGQHPADQVRQFMQASLERPGTLIVGQPIFGPEAPKVRLYGRKLSVGLVKLQTGWSAIADPLYGFRVYPLQPLLAVMKRTRSARRYDFDPEVAVRMVWAGVPTLNIPARCRYLSPEEGGVSHFNYVRDNVRMVSLHARLLVAWLFWHAWVLAARRFSRNRAPAKI